MEKKMISLSVYLLITWCILQPIMAQKDSMHAIEKIPVGKYTGPEDMAFDKAGNVYMGVENGIILKYLPSSGTIIEFAHNLGRPLGMKFDDKGNLYVCDAVKGLLVIDSSGNISDPGLCYHDKPILFTDGIDIDAKGNIFFTEASCKYPFSRILDDWGQPNGRVFKYNPETARLTLLADSLCFANGIALYPDEKALLVSESSCNRVTRISLSKRPGRHKKTFLKDLPGPPDGIAIDAGKTCRIAIYDGDLIVIKPEGTRSVISIKPFMPKFTSVHVSNNRLYLGNIGSDFFGIISLGNQSLQ